MRTAALLSLLLVATASNAADPKPADKPIPTKDAASKMTVPDGFKVTLFAGEPDIVQPIAFTFDDRGRMWVVECLSYPKWSKDGKGTDRVVILEDTKGTGTFDKKTVFMADGVNLSGIEIGFGGVWLCSSPNLVFVPILEGDKPGKPEVKLDGWNMIDTKHNIFNSLVWGPDGCLYGCNGIQAKAWIGAPGTPKDKRTYMDCGVWKYHPTRKTFEVVAHGTTNPFGLDFDDHGELFITNCVIDHLFHFVPGGHYERMYGQDANPHTYQLMKSCVDYRHWGSGSWTDSRANKDGTLKKEHDDAGGGHAHSGAAIYLGDNFPKEYRNTLFTANIHGNRLNNDGLERTKSGMKGVRRPDFLFANDSWFRGICVKTGPEGALYVSDWCDTGECHNYDKADITNGRIYRVVYKGAKPFKGDISKMTDAELVKLQLSPNDWFVRKARRVLQERAAAGKLSKNPEAGFPPVWEDELDSIAKDNKDITRRLRAYWTLSCIDRLTYRTLEAALKDPNEVIRAWAHHLADNENFHTTRRFRTIVNADMITKEQSPYVLLHVASVLQFKTRRGNGVSPEDEELFRALLTHKELGTDSQLLQMVWYAAEAYRSTRSSGFPVSPAEVHPQLRRNMIRHKLTNPDPQQVFDPRPDLLPRLERVALDDILDVIFTTREWKNASEIQLDVLRGVREAFAGRKNLMPPRRWPEVTKLLFTSQSPAVKREAEAVAVLFGDKDAIAALLKRIPDASEKADERRAAVELLAPRKLPDFAKILHALLDEPAMRGSAIRALAGIADANTPVAIIKAYPKFTPEEKADAVQTLAARVSFAKDLLDAVEKGAIPRADVQVTAARQVLALNDKAVSARLETVWGKITPVAKERAALMKKWKDVLTEDSIKKADAANGRALFTKHCASCHKMFGEGQAVGPELTGSQRTNLDYVLENVIDPSAVVPREYQLINFTLNDDRVVGGIIVRETKDAVTVRTVNDTLTIPVADIVTRKQTPLSIMPEGLFDQMKPDEVRDLVAYLRAKEQVPIPKK